MTFEAEMLTLFLHPKRASSAGDLRALGFDSSQVQHDIEHCSVIGIVPFAPLCKMLQYCFGR